MSILNKKLEARVKAIEDRNNRVGTDKAWETSLTRRLSIAGITYLIAVWFMDSIEVENAWLSALIPTGGYVLSTISLPAIRKMWESNRDED